MEFMHKQSSNSAFPGFPEDSIWNNFGKGVVLQNTNQTNRTERNKNEYQASEGKTKSANFDNLYQKHGGSAAERLQEQWEDEQASIRASKRRRKDPREKLQNDWAVETAQTQGFYADDSQKDADEDALFGRDLAKKKNLERTIQKKIDDIDEEIRKENERFSNMVKLDEWRYEEDAFGNLRELTPQESRIKYGRMNAVYEKKRAALENERAQLEADLRSINPLYHGAAVEKLAQNAANDQNFESLAEAGRGAKDDAVVMSNERRYALADGVNYAAHPKYELMTDAEYQTYCYFLATGQKSVAEAYLEQLDPALTKRLAEQNADIVMEDGGIGAAITSAGNGLAKAASNVKTTVKRALGDTSAPEETYFELMQGNMREQMDGAWGVVSDIMYGLGASAPALALGVVNPLAGASLMAVTTFGDCYTIARRAGKNDAQALSYGIVSGLTETATQTLLGGVSKLRITGENFGIFKGLHRVISEVSDNPAVQRVLLTFAKMGEDGMREAFQEYLQQTLDGIVRNDTLDENGTVDLYSQDRLYSALVAAITGVASNALSGDYAKRHMDDFQRAFLDVNEEDIKPPRDITNDQAQSWIERCADYVKKKKEEFAAANGAEAGKSSEITDVDAIDSLFYTNKESHVTPENVQKAGRKAKLFGEYSCNMVSADGSTSKVTVVVDSATAEHLCFAQTFPSGDGGTKLYSKKGIGGAHTMDAFYKAVTSNGGKVSDSVVKCVPHPKIDGIYDIYYSVPRGDGGMREIRKPKTIVDPRKISSKRLFKWVKEALSNGTIEVTSGGQYCFTGYAKNGLCFQGYVKDGRLTSIFPVIKERR